MNETDKSDNTVIFFFSDNGGLSTAEGSPTCNSPLKDGKGWMYEGGIRDPLIIKYPKLIKPGSITSIPVISTDFFPTILELAHLPLHPELHADGVSILPILQGNTKFAHPPMFWHFPHYGNQGGTPAAAVREGDYKLIYFFENKLMELYNVKEDIEEKHEISVEKLELRDHLQSLLNKWLLEVDAKIPVQNPDYRPYWLQRLKEFCQRIHEKQLHIDPRE